MRRAVLAGLAALAVTGVVLMWPNTPKPAAEAGDPARLDALPRVALNDFIGSEPAALVVFSDGYGRWYAVDNAAPLRDVEIGIYTDRFFEIFTGGQHIPLRDEDGKELIVSHEGRVITQRAFINPDRMDLRALRPLARPVTLHRRSVPRLRYADELAKITAMPEARVVRAERNFPPFAFSRWLTGSALWWTGADAWPLQFTIEAAVQDVLDDGLSVRADL